MGIKLDVEAHSGDVMTKVEEAAKNSLAYKPNIVLINAGTNDCDINVEPDKAGQRMSNLIETLINAPDMDNTLIVLSTLIPSGSTSVEANRASVNARFRALVPIKYPDDYNDNKYSNDYGYSKLAAIWYNAIYDAAKKGLIATPADLNTTSPGTCGKEYGSGVYAGGFTQQGSGEDDGIYRHDSEYNGALFSVRAGRGAADPYSDDDELSFFFGRLYTIEYDDLTIFQKDRQAGDGLNVVWPQRFYKDANSGRTHPGLSGIFGTFGLRDQVYFARVYGEVADFGELGRQDYVFIEKDTSDENSGPMYNVHVWKNKGAGGAKIKADGNRYCNMKVENGLMDYVCIHSTGYLRLYPNKGLVELPSDGSSFWGANEIIFDPTREQIGTRLDRRDLHLADWDGDGACDIIWTDPNNQNRVQVWRNKVKETGSIEWEYNSNAADQLYCPERRGLGYFDRPVNFADVSSNGKADYLCVEKDGRT
ncbi:hypothetical protein BDV09DRAFT_194284 [Aspergillus tetrazonus]